MLGLSAVLPAHANTGDSNDNAETANNTVVITATRTEQSLDSTLAATTVITRDDIERYQARDLPELLNRVTGLTVTTQGTKGSLTSLFTRGTNSSHTLIIVDGQRLNSATTGATAFQFISPDQIERIEIVRGARASLYGSDAIGGVIQIFTKQGSQKATGLVKIATGTNNTQEIQFGAQGGFEKTQFNFEQSYSYSGGFDSNTSEDVLNKDDDAFNNKTLNTFLKHQLNDRISLTANYMQNKGSVEYDNSYNLEPFSDFELEAIRLSSDVDINAHWGASISIGKSTDLITYQSEDENDTPSIFETNRSSASLQNEVAVTEQQTLVVAYDFFDDKLVDATGYAETTRKTEAIILQYLADFDRYGITTSVREDRIERFGREITESIDFGWHFSSTLHLIASWGSAFKAPTFNDLYFSYGGNPDLNPESSINREIGFKGTSFQGQENQISWQINAFQNRIDQLIQWNSTEHQTVNIDQAEIKGVELSLATTLKDWSLNGNLSYVDPENTATGKQLARRPKQTFNLDVDRRWQKMSIGASLHANNERFDDAANTVEVAGFGTVDLRTAYHCSDELKFQLSVTNLFDQDYQLVDTYNTEGLGAMLSVVYQPTL